MIDQHPGDAAQLPEAPPTALKPLAEKPSEESTVGTGSYIGISCALGMLVLTVVLIGVVYLLRWIG